MQEAKQIKDVVKERYGKIAKKSSSNCGCGCSGAAGNQLPGPDYSDIEGHYSDADLGLGCGIPTQFAEIKAGHTVLDLGSGAGNDVFVARSIVGDSGRVIGVDMTAEMIAKANQNLSKLGYKNVEFKMGEIESLPVNSGDVDVIISNCVLNLVPDKLKAFQEMYRVLKPGGHFCISDIVLQGELPEKIKSIADLYAACIAGALTRDEYIDSIKKAGFTDISIKKDQQFSIGDSELAQYLNKEEIEIYKKSNTGIFSITVFGRK